MVDRVLHVNCTIPLELRETRGTAASVEYGRSYSAIGRLCVSIARKVADLSALPRTITQCANKAQTPPPLTKPPNYGDEVTPSSAVILRNCAKPTLFLVQKADQFLAAARLLQFADGL